MDKNLENKTVVIPKDKATFWMDARGRWQNRHGPFENKKIIDYFNSAIKRDGNGYYVAQQKGRVAEKVYFDYEDTALFVVDILNEEHTMLLLNTRDRIPLLPDKLFIRKDQLYILNADDRIKFSERALLKVAEQIAFDNGRYFFSENDQHHLISSDPADASIAKL